jgi:hypothetical protein
MSLTFDSDKKKNGHGWPRFTTNCHTRIASQGIKNMLYYKCSEGKHLKGRCEMAELETLYEMAMDLLARQGACDEDLALQAAEIAQDRAITIGEALDFIADMREQAAA